MRIRALFLFLVVALSLTAAAMLRAGDLDSRFEEANKLYEEGRYAAAASAYDKLIGGGSASEALYFNRGNAFLKAGQIGRAIASYRSAERLSPRDPDLRANLQLARTQARGGAAYHVGFVQRSLRVLSLNEWTALTSLSLWALFALLAVREWRPQLGERLRVWLMAAGGAALLFGICLVGSMNYGYFASTAIVTVGEADVRNGPLDESASAYKVRDGAELEVVDEKEGWIQVADPSQRLGWVRRDQVLIFDSVGERK